MVLTELEPEIARTTRTVIAERARVASELSGISGVEVTPSQADFLWIRCDRPAGAGLRRAQAAERARAQLPRARRSPGPAAARDHRHAGRERRLLGPACARCFEPSSAPRASRSGSSRSAAAQSGERVTRVAGGFRDEESLHRHGELLGVHERRDRRSEAAEFADARFLYRQALDSDGESPEIQTRIGAVSCQLASRGARTELEAAERAFEEGRSSSTRPSPPPTTSAPCARARVEPARSSPAGRSSRGEVRFLAGRVHAPRERALVRSAAPARSLGLARRASRRAPRIRPRSGASIGAPPSGSKTPSGCGVRSRTRRDSARRSLAPKPRTPRPSTLCSCSATLPGRANRREGPTLAEARSSRSERWRSERSEAGYEQAMLVLRADPGDADAWIAALAAAEEQRRPERFEAALRALDTRPLPPPRARSSCSRPCSLAAPGPTQRQRSAPRGTRGAEAAHPAE